MDVNQIVALAEAAPRQLGGTDQNERAILKVIARLTASLVIERDAGHF